MLPCCVMLHYALDVVMWSGYTQEYLDFILIGHTKET